MSALGSADVSVLLNGTHPLAPQRRLFSPLRRFQPGPAALFAESVAVGDLNGDGKLDIVTADHQPGGKISVLLNTTDRRRRCRGLGARGSVSTPATTVGTPGDFGDMNGDGKLDVDFVSNNGGNGVDILLNTMAPGSLAPVLRRAAG